MFETIVGKGMSQLQEVAAEAAHAGADVASSCALQHRDSFYETIAAFAVAMDQVSCNHLLAHLGVASHCNVFHVFWSFLAAK
jgi:hypothetical protein